MGEPALPFQHLTQALANLNEADLLSLLKAVDGLKLARNSDPALVRQLWQATGIFHQSPSEHPLTLAELVQLSQNLNPAELEVLSTLITFHLYRDSYTDGQQVSASWGSTNPHVAYRTDVSVSGAEGVSWEDMQQRADLFKSVVALIQPAQDAKTAGDNQKATALFEQAMRLLAEQGFEEPILAVARNLFQL
jgi:hypothetical protein